MPDSPRHDRPPPLSEEELREIQACLDAGAPLPDKYRFRLFARVPEPLLLWWGKTDERCREAHPLAAREIFPGRRSEAGAPWRNLLIRADNRPALSSLLRGPLRRAIEAAGGIKLMYIDPPFAVGADFTMPVGAASEKSGRAAGNRPGERGARPCALAYSDQWAQGVSSFLRMIHERLLLMRDLLAGDGSLYLHCDWRLAPHMRLVLDEVFGPERFLGDIVWHYTGGGRSRRYFSRKHDRLLHYAASRRWIFNPDAVRVPYKPTSGYARGGITSATGKHYSPNPLGTPVDDVWDIPMINPLARERLDYPTQKPEALLERIIKASSRPGDLVADFFCGSGTLPAVAETLGRNWLAVDSSPLAVHAARKRLLKARACPPPGAENRTFILAELAADAPVNAPAHADAAASVNAFAPADTSPAIDAPPSVDVSPCAGLFAPACESGALPEGGGLARFMHSEIRFRHEARFPRQALGYSLGCVRVATRVVGAEFSLELAGFSLAACENAAPGGQRAGTAGERAKDRDAFASLLLQGWQTWLDYWSIGIPADEACLITGMEKDLLCNRVLWHSARKRKGAGPELASPPLPLPDRREDAREPLTLILTIVDMFANESRLPLHLALE